MDKFYNFIQKQFYYSLIFFSIGLLSGIIYSINLLGFSIDSQILLPSNIRSLHISLMLYGFIPLMLSYLPFLLINKETGYSQKGLYFLNLYTIFWYIFLVFMVVSLLFGNTRGLSFYDFPYELNFILAFAGVFYIFALYNFIKLYKEKPLWVKVCLRIVFIAPIALLILMNPIIGQVESTISGPHGDNTLGMSLSLIPLYYLIIKLLSKEKFKAKWNIFWIIPLAFYFASVLYRSFYIPLTYNQEWFLQYLSLLYVPLLYRWFKDCSIDGFARTSLLISISAFLFVDIQGNILFIPELRWLFHRNDLIVAHAHVAMGISIFFMVVSMYVQFIKELNNKRFYFLYLFGILGIFLSLSISGFVQANILSLDINTLWGIRTFFGLIALLSLISFIKIAKNYNPLQIYNLIGVLSDGLGGIFLFIFASYLYPLLGFSFTGTYEYIVFAFVITTGILHLSALLNPLFTNYITKITVVIRILLSSVFFSLFISKTIGIEALMISAFDFSFALIFLLFFYEKEKIWKN